MSHFTHRFLWMAALALGSFRTVRAQCGPEAACGVGALRFGPGLLLPAPPSGASDFVAQDFTQVFVPFSEVQNDFAVAVTAGAVSLRRQTLPGVFSGPGAEFVPVAAPTGPIASGDLDHQGGLDLVVATSPAGAPGALTVLLNAGGVGGFVALPPVATGILPSDIVVRDANSDGKEDVFVSNAGPPGSVMLFLNDGAGGLTLAATHPVPCGAGPMVVDHLDDPFGIGFLDVVVACPTSGRLFFLSDVGGVPPQLVPREIAPLGTSVGGLALSDVDGDFRTDLLVSFMSTAPIGGSPAPRLGILLNQVQGASQVFVSGGSFGLGTAGTFAVGDVVLGDLDEDGAVDAVVAFSDIAGSGATVLRGTGPLQFSAGPNLLGSAGGPVRVLLADLDDDSTQHPGGYEDRLDVALLETSNARITRFRNTTFDALAGNVNSGLGPVADVLFVNDAGVADPMSPPVSRVVHVYNWEPLTIYLQPPPAATGPTNYVLYIWKLSGTSDADLPIAGISCLPSALGETSMPMPPTGACGFGPPVFIGNLLCSFGNCASNCSNQLGCDNWPADANDQVPGLERPAAAPGIALHRTAGLGESFHGTWFIQGIIQDPGAAGGATLSVTNGVTLIVD